MPNIFSTPVLTPMIRVLAKGCLRLSGWKVEAGALISPPCVLIGAPHTSNWDLLLLLLALLDLRLDAFWLGKHTLFRFPYGCFMRWLGGLPVVRDKSLNQVTQTAQLLALHPDRILCLAPEGTRRKVAQWRSGFYHIAVQADVPIVMAVIDAKEKVLRVIGEFHPTGDIAHDLPRIQRHYLGFCGLRPENAMSISIDEPDSH